MSSVKVHFQLTQDADGYPPVGVESLWAEPGPSAGEYVIDNVPFFVREATLGDTVLAREADGNLWFERVLRRSRNSLFRVRLFDESAKQRVSDALTAIGCATEYFKQRALLSVSIPDPKMVAGVQNYLRNEATSGVLDYEEPIIID